MCVKAASYAHDSSVKLPGGSCRGCARGVRWVTWLTFDVCTVPPRMDHQHLIPVMLSQPLEMKFNK